MLPTGHATGTESGSFDIDRLAFGRIHREDLGISALLSGAGVDDSEHLLAPARPARTRRCPLAASRFDVDGRSVNICPGDQTINDRFLGARRCTCGIQDGPPGPGYFRDPACEFAVAHPRAPSSLVLLGHRPRCLGLDCCPKGSRFAGFVFLRVALFYHSR
jgi:hypothetical protein